MKLRYIGLLAGLLLGGALIVVGLSTPVAAAAPCCSIVKFDTKTRVVTVRDSAGKTYECQVPAGQHPSVMKAGAKVDLDIKAAAKHKGGTGSTAQGCGGWNGPRSAPTKPTGTTTPPPKPK